MRRLGALFAVMFAGLVLSTPAAVAEGYLDEASQGLQMSKVYVSVAVRSVSSTDATRLSQKIGSESIAVVVLPGAASTEVGSGQAFIRELIGRSANKTILLVVGDIFFAESSVFTADELAPLLAQSRAKGLPEGLDLFVDGAIALNSAGTFQQPSSTGQSSGGFSFWELIPWVVYGLIGLIGSYVVWRIRRSKRSGVSSPLPSTTSLPPTSSPGGFVSAWDNEFPGKPGTGSGG